MNGPWYDDDPAGTIRLDESDIVEMESASDLFAPFPDEHQRQRENTVRGVSRQVAHEAPTRNAKPWDLTPAPQHPATTRRTNGHVAARPPYNEVTAVRSGVPETKERQWIDLHAVVDGEGRLRLPEDIARALQSGAIVEVRLAAWAVGDDPQ